MSWARWCLAETRSLYPGWQWSHLPQAGPFEYTHLDCCVISVSSYRFSPLGLWRNLCSHREPGQHMASLAGNASTLYRSILSNLHNKRDYLLGVGRGRGVGTEIALLLKNGKQRQQNEFFSRSHQGLFYCAWHPVRTSLVIWFLNL